MNKKESLKLFEECKDLLLHYGFKPTINKCYDYRGKVLGGTLDATLRHGYSKTFGWCVDFYSMHSNPEQAAKFDIKCNPFSGKHNHYNIPDHILFRGILNILTKPEIGIDLS